MNATAYKRRWSRFFLGAALFNYAMGVPMFFFKAWSYNVAFLPVVGRDPMAIRMWANFGFAVLLIGLGYQIISRDINKNRGIVLVGILAKLFDVVNLSLLFIWGFARPLVLIPAFIDGVFGVFFAIFWFSFQGADKDP